MEDAKIGETVRGRAVAWGSVLSSMYYLLNFSVSLKLYYKIKTVNN